MKLGVVIATVMGLGALIALLVCNDAPAIFGMVARVGWALLLVVAVRAGILVLAGLGWGRLVRPFAAVESGVPVLLRWIRESINVLLPVAQVGGDLVGGRLLTFWRVPGGLAGASILVDLVIQIATQFVFTMVGFALLAATVADRRMIAVVAGGLGISALTLAGFYAFQRSGLIGAVERLLRRAGDRWPRLHFPSGRMHESVQAIYASAGALAASSALHLAAWFLGVVEVWIALAWMGQRPGLAECLVLESLGQAVRSADFAVPGVMGVQEGGFLAIGALYGIPAEASLALSLVKRVPDLALGLPGLLGWLLLETKRPSRAPLPLPPDAPAGACPRPAFAGREEA